MVSIQDRLPTILFALPEYNHQDIEIKASSNKQVPNEHENLWSKFAQNSGLCKHDKNESNGPQETGNKEQSVQ